MCGRYSLTTPLEAVTNLFGVAGRPNFPARYNIAPTQDVPVVRAADGDGDGDGDGGRRLDLLRWGLVPHWAKDLKVGSRMINARAESAAKSPAFRNAFRQRRCLVPADGFYEWRKLPGGTKQPYRITLKAGLFAFAGLWEAWHDPAGETVRTFTILTTDANELLMPIHDRMPVILAPADYDAWLGAEDPAAVQALLQPFPAAAMVATPVSARVNNVRNDDAACIAPAQGELL